MKLLELLVQELPKRGGWPEGYEVICSHGNGHIYAYAQKAKISGRHLNLYGCPGQDVTREQYEAALQQPVWNGEGLPPVGCEFEYGTHRSKAKCIAVGHHFVFASAGNPDDEEGEYEEMMVSILDSEFYPVRSERDKFAELLADKSIMGDDWQMQIVGLKIYDAIKAGKLGVKLSD